MSKRLIVVLIVLGLAATALVQRDKLVEALLHRGIESAMSSNLIADLEPGLHVGLCGAGGPLPAPNASGPCVVVVAGDRLFIVDAGTDGARNLGRMKLRAGDVEAVFLTHFHSDHIDGLGELSTLRWVSNANTSPLPVFGPTGVEKVVAGINAVYAQDQIYRHIHHGDTVAPMSGAGMIAKEFIAPNNGMLEVLLDADGLRVEALLVDHAPVLPAVAYRFTYKGRSVLISGDTAASKNLAYFSKGVDLLVHEALSPRLVNIMNSTAAKLGNEVLQKVTADILDYHASPVEAAQIARDAKVGHLLYYHIVPPIVLPGQEALYLDGAAKIFPNYTIGEDGVMFSLPAGSSEIVEIRSGL